MATDQGPPDAAAAAALAAAGGWVAALATYERDGFVTLPGFLSREATAELRNATEQLFASEGTDGLGAYAAPSCRRLGNLFDKGRCFEQLACDPLLVAFARHTIGADGCRWQAFNAHDPRPRQPDARQPVHADRSFFPGCTAYVNIILALDDFTPTNGAPRVVPRSRSIQGDNSGAWPAADSDSALLEPVAGETRILCAAGAAIICHGDTWHGGMENWSDVPRRALHLGFSCPATRPQYEITAECSAAMRERVAARGLAALLPQPLASFDSGLPPDRPNKVPRGNAPLLLDPEGAEAPAQAAGALLEEEEEEEEVVEGYVQSLRTQGVSNQLLFSARATQHLLLC